MNEYGWWTIGLLVVALLCAAVLIYRQRTQKQTVAPAPAEPLAKVVSSAVAPHTRALEQSVVAHVADWGAAIRSDISKLRPSAPAPAAAAATNAVSAPQAIGPAPAAAAAQVIAAPMPTMPAATAAAPVAAVTPVAAPPVLPAVSAPAPNPAVPAPATVAATPPAAAVFAGDGGTSVYPQIIAVHGVNMRLDAPVNPDYRPAMSAWVFGHAAGTFVGEPSNGAKVGMPLRSAAGYPLFYAIGGDGKVVGTPSVLQGDQQFNSDAEVAAYNVTTTTTPAQAAQNSADWARVGAAIAAQAAPRPQPAPQPVARIVLEPSYANAASLTADIVAIKFAGAVTLDGAVINSGFGQASGAPWAYTTQANGTVVGA